MSHSPDARAFHPPREAASLALRWGVETLCVLVAAAALVHQRLTASDSVTVPFSRNGRRARWTVAPAEHASFRALTEAFATALPFGAAPDLLPGRWEGSCPLVGVASDGGFFLEWNEGERPVLSREGWQRRLEALLHSAHQQPDAPLAKLSLRDAAGPAQPAMTERAFDLRKTLPQRFLEHAARAPDAPAVFFEGKRLNYGALAQRASREAQRLRELGVKPETLVAVMMRPGLELLVALMAILQAGGGYLPLDPSYPRERLRFMLEDARPALLLADDDLDAGAFGVPVHRLGTTETGPSRDAHPLHAIESGLAYVIYTSGSTGQPKGVMVEHGSLTNELLAMAEAIQFGATDRMMAVTPLSFDISVEELFLPLITGGSLVLCPRAVAMDGVQLAQRLRESGASVLNATPTTYRMLQLAGWTPPPRFKQVVGGEALPLDLARWLSQSAPLYNGYGPTETTITATVDRVVPTESSIRIGRPLANLRAYVVDGEGRPSAVGEPGELLIGGAGVARGYLRRPELTADRFSPDPFAPGGRVYRTGDLVRWDEEGRLEFLGRLDRQVKIRGHRLELAEIEVRLLSHPAVTAGVVIAQPTPGSDPRLVAYFLSGDTLPPLTLRAFLQERLPAFMVPSLFIQIPALPLLPSGKVDLQALPAPGQTPRFLSTPYRAPTTELEARCVDVWESVLGVDRIGLDDDFFQLGGTSLQAAQVLHELARDLSFNLLHQHPTIAQLAKRLGAETTRPVDVSSAVILPRDIPVGFAQQHYLDVESQVTFIVKLQGDLSVPALRLSLDDLVQREAALQVRFHSRPEGFVQRLERDTIVLEEVDLTSLGPAAEAEALRRLQAETVRPASLSEPVRFQLYRLSADSHVLLLLIHHALFDGSSWPLAIRHLNHAYRHFHSGAPLQPAEAPRAFLEFCLRQQQQLDAGAFAEPIAHWERALAVRGQLALREERPLRRRHGPRGRHPLQLDGEALETLRSSAQEAGLTLPSVLMAAAAFATRSRWQGERLTLGTVWNAQPEALRTIGCFTRGFWFDVEDAGSASLIQAAAQLQAQLASTLRYAPIYPVAGYAGTHAPGLPQAVWSRMREVDVWVNYLAFEDVPLQLGDVTASVLEPDGRPSYWTLVLGVDPLPQSLRLSWGYRTDLFTAGEVETFARCLHALLTHPLRPMREVNVAYSPTGASR